jgi:hypothetical protein
VLCPRPRLLPAPAASAPPHRPRRRRPRADDRHRPLLLPLLPAVARGAGAWARGQPTRLVRAPPWLSPACVWPPWAWWAC